MLAINIGNSLKLKIYNSRFIKYFRLGQECSYSMILAIIFIIYEDENSRGFSSSTRFRLEASFCILVGLNILIEFVILVKNLGRLFTCCKKKELNKVHPLDQQNPTHDSATANWQHLDQSTKNEEDNSTSQLRIVDHENWEIE